MIITTHKIDRNKTITMCHKSIDELNENEFLSYTWFDRKNQEKVNCKHCKRYRKDIKKYIKKEIDNFQK